MSKAKKTKSRGRPPKYVLDDEGKEIVGLSYNDSNNMYYATGTNPRHYFQIPFQVNKKQEAIRQFHEWKNSTGYTPEEIEEQRQKNEIFQKAVQLIKDGFFDALVEKKAREWIADDYYVKEELLERAKKLLMGEHCIPDHPKIRYAKSGFDQEIKLMIKKYAQERAKKWINRGIYDKDVWERAYDLIEKNPIDAARTLGIKEIIYANTKYKLPMQLDTAWEIFYSYRSKDSFLYAPNTYFTIKTKMSYTIGSPFLDNIKYAEFSDALLSYPPIRIRKILVPIFGRKTILEEAKKEMKALMDAYTAIPMMDRLEILEDVFTTVKNAGYEQVNDILQLVRDFAAKQ